MTFWKKSDGIVMATPPDTPPDVPADVPAEAAADALPDRPEVDGAPPDDGLIHVATFPFYDARDTVDAAAAALDAYACAPAVDEGGAARRE